MFNKTIDSFIKELQRNNPNIEKEEVEELIEPLKKKIFRKTNIDEMIKNTYDESKLFKYIEQSPGFTFNFKTNNIDILLYGGTKDLNKNPVNQNTMFDAASITKMYTMLIIHKLFELNIIRPTTKVKDILKYPNIEDITINELIYFCVKFSTNRRIDETTTRMEALDALHNVKIERCLYDYNDIGCMILKEIAEKVTNVSYEELLKSLVLDKIDCKNTESVVSIQNKNNITGTPNIEKKVCNDAKAAMLGGSYGHAGIFVSSKDLTKMMQEFIEGKLVNPYNFYTPGISGTRSLVGNVWCKGSNYVDSRFPLKSICIQGSTRVQANAAIFELDKKYTVISNVLLNPSTISKEEALEKENLINRRYKPKTKIKIYKEINGFKQVDARYIMPVNETIIPLNKEISNIMIKLLYIEYIMSKYEKNPNFKKEVTKILVR